MFFNLVVKSINQDIEIDEDFSECTWTVFLVIWYAWRGIHVEFLGHCTSRKRPTCEFSKQGSVFEYFVFCKSSNCYILLGILGVLKL